MPLITKDFYRTTRFKTTLWYAGLFLLLEVVIGIIIYSYLRNGLLRDLDESLSKQAQTIYEFVSGSDNNLLDFKPDSLYESKEDLVFNLIFEAIVVNPRSTFIQVKLNEEPIFQTENLKRHLILIGDINPGQLTLISFEDKFLSDYELRAAYLLKDKYEIIVAFPTVLIAKTLQKLEELIIIIGPLFLLIAIMGGALISTKSLSRIDSIINRTKEITAQNLNEKIPGGDHNDEYGRLVKTMNEMISRIKTSIDYMEQFSTAASHELKTPLTILRGEIEVALKSPKPAEEYKQILKSNYEETLRLTNIVNKLFFASRLDNYTNKLQKEEVIVGELLRPIVDHMRTSANTKNMMISLDINEDYKLLVDVELMSTAITNLVDNAIKYGESNTTVRISTGFIKPNLVFISVTNSGETIPKVLHEKIFERFFRYETARNREAGGAGLGLSIVKSIVALHNGEVMVSSGNENETRFFIYLNPTGI